MVCPYVGRGGASPARTRADRHHRTARSKTGAPNAFPKTRGPHSPASVIGGFSWEQEAIRDWRFKIPEGRPERAADGIKADRR